MTLKQQEKLFRLVRERFKKWSRRKASGYVHGVVDESKYTRPRLRQINSMSPRRSYAIGYIYGFIDARGLDAFDDPRFAKKRLSKALEHVWWEDEL